MAKRKFKSNRLPFVIFSKVNNFHADISFYLLLIICLLTVLDLKYRTAESFRVCRSLRWTLKNYMSPIVAFASWSVLTTLALKTNINYLHRCWTKWGRRESSLGYQLWKPSNGSVYKEIRKILQLNVLFSCFLFLFF